MLVKFVYYEAVSITHNYLLKCCQAHIVSKIRVFIKSGVDTSRSLPVDSWSLSRSCIEWSYVAATLSWRNTRRWL